ncbi:MAG: phage holin family protein [Candidatus Gracilibacteria bacterium]|nr:phage holin family protein [Candidatus Gracilibacteria bacterium]
MKIIFSILLNASILYLLEYFLAANGSGTVTAGIVVTGGIVTYIIGGIILGLLNITIKPILKILTLPLFFVFFFFVTFIVNGIILWLFDRIINTLKIQGVGNEIVKYEIDGWINFIIAVAIFTILNMIYSLLFSKK